MEELREHRRYKVLGKPSWNRGSHFVFRGVSGSQELNTFDLRPPAVSLEVEDQSFHHNSAVMLPALKSNLQPTEEILPGKNALLQNTKSLYPEWYKSFEDWFIPEGSLRRFEYYRRGLAILAISYLFLEQNPRYRLLLSGHTDTSGDGAYNFGLSDLRAENVDCLLRGDRDRWIAIVFEKCQVEDVQLICSYLNHTSGWPCDPGPVNNEWGPSTQNAIKGLQNTYNQTFDKSILVDGLAGWETWGAIFDIYMSELAHLLEIEPEELPKYRSQLRYADENYHRIGCGEQIPIDQTKCDNYRSAENRRVEFLFFDEDYLPDLSAHLKGGEIRSGKAGPEASAIYCPGAYRFVYINPEWWTGGALPISDSDSPRPRVETIEESLDDLPVPPNCPEFALEVFEPTREEAIEEGLYLELEESDEE